MERKPKKPKVSMMVDSGAYSAWKLKKEVSLNDYCDFLHDNLDWIDSYVSMDVIIPRSPEKAAAAGFKNFQIMRARGLEPIPVYHAGEDISWLLRYLDAGCKYIGISASSLSHTGRIADDWYDLVWAHLATSEGKPCVKTHVFGEGRLDTVGAYPWWSADSATWIHTAQRNAKVYIPGVGHALSLRKDGRSTPSARDASMLHEHDQVVFDDVLKKYHIDPKMFMVRSGPKSYCSRSYLACMYYLEGEKDISARCPILYNRSSLQASVAHPGPSISIPQARFYLALGSNPSAEVIFAMCDARRCLISYEYIRHYESGRMRKFVYDPIAACLEVPRLKQYYDHMQEVLGEK